MAKRRMLIVAALACGCATGNVAPTSASGPKLYVFDGGNGRTGDFQGEFAQLARDWSAPGGEAQIRGNVAHWRQQLGDGTVIERELVVDDLGRILGLKLYRTTADGSRSGFRVVGPVSRTLLPAPLYSDVQNLFGQQPLLSTR